MPHAQGCNWRGRGGAGDGRHSVPTCEPPAFRLLYEPIMTNLSGRQAISQGTKIGGLAVAFGFAAVIGCAGSPKTGTESQGTAGGGNVAAPPPVDRARCKSDGKQVIQSDTNLDKKPDVWKYFVPNGQGAQVMTCRQVDLNHDGKVDITYYYDDLGAQTILDEVDLDFDGRVDLTTYYTAGRKVREELDTNYDNQPDVWKFYEDDKLVRIERDADFNGKVDQWEYYEGGKLDRIGYDTSGSGRVDKWDRAPEGADEAADTTAAAQAAAAAGAKPPVAAPPTPAATAPAPTAPAAASPSPPAAKK